jgi:hypothetical protein
MTNPHDIAKRDGVIALAKRIVESGESFPGFDEYQMTNVTIAAAKAQFPGMTDAQAFAKLFSDTSPDGVVLRKAFAVIKNAAHANDTDESQDAMRELAAIGARRFPHLSPAQQFAKAAECNPSLLAKAHKRPSAASSFPFPE